MKLLHESHQIHFFVDNSDVTVNPHLMGTLLTRLGKHNVMPTFGNVINAITGEKKQYINMVNSDESLRIEFPLDRIVIAKEGGDLNAFLGLSATLFTALNEIFPEKKANRLSIVNTRVFQGDTNQYNDIYRNLFTYKQAIPFEWDNRIAERKQLPSGELLNSISTVRRCRLAMPRLNVAEAIDGIICELDVNTINENRTPRFSLDDAHEKVKELSEELIRGIELLRRYF